MIKKLEVEDIAKILVLDDDIKSLLPCTKGEWVQWLISQVDNPLVYIVGDVIDDELRGYAVLVNNVNPPLFDACSALFIWSKTHKVTLALAAAGEKWKDEIGAKRGVVVVPLNHTEKYLNSFGGRLIANVYEF